MILLRAALVGVLALAVARAEDDYNKYTSVGEIGLTITNFGVIGHGYNIEGQPSCLYKQYSNLDFEQVEHFSYGGLWVGGLVDGEARVSTAVMDGTFGGEGWEWNNAGEFPEPDSLFSYRASKPDTVRPYEILQRSSLNSSSFYRPDAISHQDFLMSFTDTSRVVPASGEAIENHTPLGLRVDLASYAWNYAFADAFVILDLTMTNISADMDPAGRGWPIDSVFVGYWIDEAVGNFNLHHYYEPGRGGWNWNDNLAGIVVTDSAAIDGGHRINMAVGYDADGDNGYSESFVGVRFLGGSSPEVDNPQSLRPQADTWIWNGSTSQEFPALVTPANELERYQRMQTTPPVDNANFPYGTANTRSWMMLSSAGNFGRLNPAEPYEDLDANGRWDADEPFEDANGNLAYDEAQSLNAVFTVACGPRVFVPEGSTNWDPANSGANWLQASTAKLIANTDWALIAWRGEDKNGNGRLDEGEDLDFDGVLDRYLLPTPPPAPAMRVELGQGEATVYWRDDPERFVDPILGTADFEGYRVYSSPLGSDAQAQKTLLLQVDVVDDVWANTGLEDIGVRRALGIDADSVLFVDRIAVGADSVVQDSVWYPYAFRLTNLPTGNPAGYWVAVTSYDRGQPENNLASLESDIKENWVFLYPGSLPAGADTLVARMKPGVYPNPYRVRASWDGPGAYERALWFSHLPARCTITIFTLAGDLVDRIEHDAASYRGEDNALMAERWQQVTAGGDEPVPFLFSGGEHAWDLVSRHDQAIATGLYLFTVEDHATGKVEIGKFAVIK